MAIEKYYVWTTKDGRISAVISDKRFAGDDYVEVDLPEDFTLDNFTDYKIVDGNVVRDPLPQDTSELVDMQMRKATMMLVEMQAKELTDEQAESLDMLFPDWQVGGNYEQGDILRYNGELCRVSQKVTGAQADHTPDKAVSLYKKIGEPTGGLFPWSQPQGAHDAYKKGDKVSHNGKTWVSTVDSNVWEPGVYGWDEVKE